jgi:hypothetical protein
MDEQEYRALDALNHSNLKNFLRSPWHYRNPVDKKPTEQMLMGSGLHCMYLEGEKEFNKRFIVMPDVDGRTSEGKAIKKRFEEECGGKSILKSDSMERIMGMYSALMCRSQMDFINDKKEFSLMEHVLLGKIAGKSCKAKVDIICPEHRLIVDVKTAADASMHTMKRVIADNFYHTQGAFYCTLAEQVFGTDGWHFVIAAVENDQPHGLNVIRFDNDLMKKSKGAVHIAVERLLICEQTDYFEDYGDNLLTSVYGLS